MDRARDGSPDRVDALVWGLTDLLVTYRERPKAYMIDYATGRRITGAPKAALASGGETRGPGSRMRAGATPLLADSSEIRSE